MKKMLLIFGAVLSGLYALLSLWQTATILWTYDPTSARGISEIAVSIVPPCIGGAICFACINGLRRKPPTSNDLPPKSNA